MKPSSIPRPIGMRKENDRHLRIDWDDGRSGMVAWDVLRKNCPCAGCRDEREKPPDPFRVLKPHEIPAGPLKPVSMPPVGYYAYRIVWSDGHDAGIYTFDTLRALCKLDSLEQPVDLNAANQE